MFDLPPYSAFIQHQPEETMNNSLNTEIEHPIPRTLFTVITTLIVMLIIVSTAATGVYWLAGGEFQRSPALAGYTMVLLYLWTLVFKIAVESHSKRKISELL